MHNSEYLVNFNPNKMELLAAYRLRARVFCDELQWVQNVCGLDIDQFDSIAEHIVIIGPTGAVCATTRLIMGHKPWMLEKVFRDLLPATFSPDWKTAAAEVSRFAVDQEYRCKKSGQWTITDLLVKAIYLRCRQSSVEHIHMVTSRTMTRFLRSRGYPIKVVGPEKTMPDGVSTVMSAIHWSDLHFGTRLNERKLSRWFAGQHQNSPAWIATETAW